MTTLTLQNINKEYSSGNNLFSLDNINLTVPHGETLVILGPSGCGKTTLLKIIGGLLTPDSGEVFYNNMLMNDISPKERRIGFVFQDYALYPHFTSENNILAYFNFRKKTEQLKKAKSEAFQKTSELMGVDIKYLLKKKPGKLLNSEKQRVAIARCITREPSLFLMDEPFNNLDPKLREKYRINLKKLLKSFNVTTVYVTHDQQEALILADKIAIMNNGRIEQVGTYKEIYNNPKNTFVADFLSCDPNTPAINFIDGKNISTDYSDKTIGVRPENIEIYDINKKYKFVVDAHILDTRKYYLDNILFFNVEIGKNKLFFKAKTREKFADDSTMKIGFNEYLLFNRDNSLAS